MSALTYDIGDTARINLQIVDPATALPADATTVTTTVTAPNGTVTAPTATHYGAAGSGQYYTAFTVDQAGVWRGKFTSTGIVVVEPFTLIVAADSALAAWAPPLTAVADWIPARTRPADPGAGSDIMAGTFNAATIPTGEQVARLISSAAAYTASATGPVDPALYDLAATTTAQRAAAYVEYAYPERSADLNTADKLLALADASLARLVAANLAVTGVPVGVAAAPYWSFPDPVRNADLTIT